MENKKKDLENFEKKNRVTKETINAEEGRLLQKQMNLNKEKENLMTSVKERYWILA